MIDSLLKTNDVIGVIGQRSQAKTSLVLCELAEVKKRWVSLPIHVLGAERSLEPSLRAIGFNILEDKMDVLDLKIKNGIIYIPEFATLFNTASESKQLEKLERFFDRLIHNNSKLIVDTAREGFFNKFMCARIQTFLVKQIEYDSLVNGTWLKERVKSIPSLSDYRLECPKNTFFIVSNKEEALTKKLSFDYDERFDSKKGNCDLFPEIISENIPEQKPDLVMDKKDNKKFFKEMEMMD